MTDPQSAVRNPQSGSRLADRGSRIADRGKTTAVFFDVDFTLIYPGPTFQGEGYAQFGARHGIEVDPARFHDAVIAASPILNEQQELVYNEDIFVRYTRRIIEEMGGTGGALDACAREIYVEWAACQHFFLYDDVTPVLRELAGDGYRIGLISNSHRCLASFQQHFELHGLITAAISSSEHGYMKPHRSIFEAGLKLLGAAPEQSVMVGDSLSHDIEGARRVGMRGVLVRRSLDGAPPVQDAGGVPVIKDLNELPALL
jgi:putative hydrolase of the HAD superfamily